jgi:hypothetical protein
LNKIDSKATLHDLLAQTTSLVWLERIVPGMDVNKPSAFSVVIVLQEVPETEGAW